MDTKASNNELVALSAFTTEERREKLRKMGAEAGYRQRNGTGNLSLFIDALAQGYLTRAVVAEETDVVWALVFRPAARAEAPPPANGIHKEQGGGKRKFVHKRSPQEIAADLERGKQRCWHCGRDLLMNSRNFYVKKDSPTGYSATCRRCVRREGSTQAPKPRARRVVREAPKETRKSLWDRLMGR